MRVVLNIAEKPSIAKSLAQALAKHNNTTAIPMSSATKFNPVYSIKGNFKDESARIVVTSVTGHIKSLLFHKRYASWSAIDPLLLLDDAEILNIDSEGKEAIITNLKNLAADATDLFLWLDCDREGEAIAYEVIEVCNRTNKDLAIHRAKFSSVTETQLMHAFKNPEAPNFNLKEAVEARKELDLRSGSAFTRFQTLIINSRFPRLLDGTIASYGPCQFPTLNFVVERFLRNHIFQNSAFWTLNLSVEKDAKPLEMTWSRTKLFDSDIVKALFEICGDSKIAKVIHVQRKEQKRSRPLPLTTITLQKIASTKLKLGSDETMKIAEKLYTSGYVSYPRTETDSFDASFNFKEIIKILVAMKDYNKFCSELNSKSTLFSVPRGGKRDDKAHPPIHPVKAFDGDRDSDEFAVFDLITRHFLACCSSDAVIEVAEVCVSIDGELFTSGGLRILEPNFLQIYSPFYNLSEKVLPEFAQGDELKVKELVVKEGSTTPPKMLSESELISLMDKYSVGTDSTIHEHIRTIQERKYAVKKRGVFRPTQLGIALLQAYKHIQLNLADPTSRGLMEKDLQSIAEGKKTRDEVIASALKEMQSSFNLFKSKENEFLNHFKEVFETFYSLSKKDITESTGQEERPQAIVNKTENPCGCGKGNHILRKSKRDLYFIGCSTYPECKIALFFIKMFN
jgi:DNA topoisomerase-3